MVALPAAHAATYHVDHAPGDAGTGVVVVANDGLCSLREALELANGGSPNDCSASAQVATASTVVLPSNAIFTLTDGPYADATGPNGLPPIASSVTITGHGASITRATLAGTPQFRFFHVTDTGSLTAANLNLSHGHAADADDVTNAAPLVGGAGGAIYSTGNLTLDRLAFTDNRSGEGGQGVVSAQATRGNAGCGGAIRQDNVYMPGSEFAEVTISNSVFANNSAAASPDDDAMIPADGGSGGAICVDGLGPTGHLTIADSTFQGNRAGNGGAADDGSRAGDGGDGGAIAVEPSNTFVNISNSVFDDNHAGDGGSGNASASSGGHGGSGGAIYRIMGKPGSNPGTAVSTTPKFAGVLTNSFDDFNTGAINDTVFTHNSAGNAGSVKHSAGGDGGALFWNTGGSEGPQPQVLVGDTFDDNSAGAGSSAGDAGSADDARPGNGGAIAGGNPDISGRQAGIFHIRGCRVTNNHVSATSAHHTARGAGIYVYTHSRDITYNVVYANVYFQLRDSVVGGNTGFGSAQHLNSAGVFINIVGPLPDGDMGNAYYTLPVIVRNSTVSRNAGAGLLLDNTSPIVIQNSTIVDNIPALAQVEGWSEYASSAWQDDYHLEAAISYSTIVGASTTAISFEGYNVFGFVSVDHSVLDASSACDTTGPHPLTITSYGNNVVSDNSCGFNGATDLVAAPMLAPLADNGGIGATRRPLPGSPLIDAVASADCAVPNGDIGDNLRGYGQFVVLDPFTGDVDQTGRARPTNGACDVGALELPPPLSFRALGENDQHAPTDDAFAWPLVVQILDKNHLGVAGVTPMLSVPDSGASARCVVGSTDSSGISTSYCTANGSVGNYAVQFSIRTASGIKTASFTLTNDVNTDRIFRDGFDGAAP